MYPFVIKSKGFCRNFIHPTTSRISWLRRSWRDNDTNISRLRQNFRRCLNWSWHTLSIKCTYDVATTTIFKLSFTNMCPLWGLITSHLYFCASSLVMAALFGTKMWYISSTYWTFFELDQNLSLHLYVCMHVYTTEKSYIFQIRYHDVSWSRVKERYSTILISAESVLSWDKRQWERTKDCC